jgi:hypothetical protein
MTKTVYKTKDIFLASYIYYKTNTFPKLSPHDDANRNRIVQFQFPLTQEVISAAAGFTGGQPVELITFIPFYKRVRNATFSFEKVIKAHSSNQGVSNE